MRRYGIFCFLGRGHLDPAIAIGRGLHARGNHVTILHLTIAQAAIRRANLAFEPIDQQDAGSFSEPGAGETAGHQWSPTVKAISEHAVRTIREGPGALARRQIDVVISDQLDVAAGTVAEAMALPFITLSCSPPIYLDESVPPPYFGWQSTDDDADRDRNARANALVQRLASPLIVALNRNRSRWKLSFVSGVNDLFSKRAIVSQLPAMLELPRRIPSHLHYVGQFRDGSLNEETRFDWARLSRQPLVYASMGTIRNTSVEVFRTIACACARFGVQLVLSLGGGRLLPRDLGNLPGNPVVVHYAPQRALLERASLAINCAGLNTALECLRNGVPMIAIPAGEDQPGVAARIARAGAGIVIPLKRLSTAGLTSAIGNLLEEPRFQGSAASIRSQLRGIDGVQNAVDLIEKVA